MSPSIWRLVRAIDSRTASASAAVSGSDRRSIVRSTKRASPIHLIPDGTGACDAAKKNVLVCQSGHFKTQLHCLGPLGCELPGNYSVRCDKSIVEQDEACTEDGAVACTADGKQVKCQQGKFSLDKKWKPKKGETCDAKYRVSFEAEKFEAR